MNIRIIPRLDIKGPNLVKGIHLEGLRVLGKPERFAQYYYESGADELLYIDAVASLYGRNSLHDIVERTSKKVFIPLTVGGGLRTVDDIQSVLRKGADKVSLNTAAIRNPKLIQEASRKFGSSTIVVSIEAIRKTDGTYEAYTDNGREKTGINAFEWALQVAELGAGEIMVTSIDREGTGKGFDLELTKKISEAISIPVIACGGAGTLNHISDAIIKGKADAVSLASMIHYRFTQQFEHKDDYYVEGNTDFLQKKRLFSERHTVSIMEIKEYLVGQSINCSNNIPGYKNI